MSAVSSVTIRSDGWSCDVTIAGWAGQQGNVVYDFDANGTPKFVLTVTSEGYDATGTLGTVTREVYGTKTVRLPYPNEASLDEVDSGSDLVIRVALSDHVYNDDKNGGAGTSGTDPTVDIAAGCFDLIVGSDPNTAVTAGAVTNNSALDYPKVIGQWDLQTTPMFDRVAADFQIGFIAYHGFQVAAVTLSAIGATSSHSQSGTVSAPTVTDHPTSGLKSESYKLSVPIAGYTQGENITLRAVAYPKVGDADSIRDTDTLTGGYADYYKNAAEITCTCDKTGGLVQYAVVDTTGVDLTGVVSATLATAEASPYLTIGAAISDGATVIYLNNGVFNPVGVAPTITTTDYWIEVRPHPSATTASITRGGSRTYRTSKLAYYNLPINGTDFIDGENFNYINKFQNCEFINSGSITTGVGYRSQGTWFIGSSYELGTDIDEFEQFSSVDMMYTFVGCDIRSATASNIFSMIVGSVFVGQGANDEPRFEPTPATSGLSFTENKVVSHNQFFSAKTNLNKVFAVGENAVENDFAFVGNIVETAVITVTQPNLWLFADGSVTVANNHVIAHNVSVGNRVNHYYNDTGTAAILRSNVFVVANAYESVNIKSDTFVSSPNGNRVGNWAQEYGVGFKDIRAGGSASSGFVGEYFGLNSINNGTAGGSASYLGFTDNASSSGTGLGNGDYTPADPSVLRNNGNALIRPIASFDLFGTPVSSQIGAVFIGSVGPVLLTGTLQDRQRAYFDAQGYTGTINDQFIQWLQSLGATSNNKMDAWRQMLDAQLPSATGNLMDDWKAWLASEGFAGNVIDAEYRYWVSLTS